MITNETLFEYFKKHYPQLIDEISDYRPLSDMFISERKGITIFLKNGDVIQYYPKVTDISDFINEIAEVYKKYHLCLEHEDQHGSFIITKYYDKSVEYLKEAIREDIKDDTEIK